MKKRKRRMKHRAARQPQMPPRATTVASSMSNRMATTRVTETVTAAIQKERYRYLPADLRQIGIIAGILFLILLVLSFTLS